MTCPYCNSKVELTDIFCPTCGKNLHKKSLSTGPWSQTSLYLASIFLPPLNMPWTLKYLKSDDPTAKTIGWISLGIMIVAIIVAVWLSLAVFQNMYSQINQSIGGSL